PGSRASKAVHYVPARRELDDPLASDDCQGEVRELSTCYEVSMRRNVVASVSLPAEIVRESAKAAKELGKSRSELVADAMKAYLSLHKFRKIQAKLQQRPSRLRVTSEAEV